MLIENCLTIDECYEIEEKFHVYVKPNATTHHDKNVTFYNNSVGLAYPFKTLKINNDKIIQRLNQIVQHNYKEKYLFSHSFMRKYCNGSSLQLHTDKPSLNLTLTVNIGGLQNWPIFFSNITLNYHLIPREENYEETLKYLKKDCYSIVTPLGYGYLTDGLHHPHWRDPLQCKDNEYVLQLFFHWTKQ